MDAETADSIREYVRGVLDELDVPGAAVVIVDADGVVFAEGYGMADDSGRQVTPQTPFRIASLSKQLTGLAVMQLVQSGELALDARISDYLPWWGADGSPVAELTIRHLLAHTAGWSERDGSLPLTGTDTDDGAMERNARRLEQTPLQYPIGEFHYMNATYDLLGYLVGEVSGLTFEEYLRTRVLDPLEMTHTYSSLADAQANGMAQGHYPFFGVTIPYDFPFSRAAPPVRIDDRQRRGPWTCARRPPKSRRIRRHRDAARGSDERAPSAAGRYLARRRLRLGLVLVPALRCGDLDG